MPAGGRLRADAPLSQIKLAVGLALIAQFTDRGPWIELGLRTDTDNLIRNHPRLLQSLARSLVWGDDDYQTCVHDVVPDLLGLREVTGQIAAVGRRRDIYLDNFPVLEERLDLPRWLAEHEPRLHRVLYGTDLAEAAAVDAVTEAIDDSLPEIVRQLDRLRRDLADDLPAAVGHAKELVESACKTILEQTGPGAGTMKFPVLVAAALKATGRHPSQVYPADPDAELVKRLLGGLHSQLDAVGGLRNRAGTGHGRAGGVTLDVSLARLVIGQALVAVEYLLRASALHAGDPPQSGSAGPR